MPDRLRGSRVLVTRSDSYMGPAIVELFRSEGASVVADTRDLTAPGACAQAVTDAGEVDVLIANLDSPAVPVATTDIEDHLWSRAFDELVHPLMRLVRAALPQMIERRRGKIVAITSSTPLRPIAPVAPYASARGAQNVFIQHVGVEVAATGVNVNAIAQNFVENPEYFPPGVMADEGMRRWIRSNNPSKRLARGEESAELALFLAGAGSDFLHGQVIPFAGARPSTSEVTSVGRSAPGRRSGPPRRPGRWAVMKRHHLYAVTPGLDHGRTRSIEGRLAPWDIDQRVVELPGEVEWHLVSSTETEREMLRHLRQAVRRELGYDAVRRLRSPRAPSSTAQDAPADPPPSLPIVL